MVYKKSNNIDVKKINKNIIYKYILENKKVSKHNISISLNISMPTVWQNLKELLDRKFLKDIELLELEDNDYVIDCKFIKPYNAHYNEYEVFVREDDEIKIYKVYLKHR